MTNVAIFVSGGGTNCEAIIRHFAGSQDVKISLVLSNRADAYALVRAQNLGIPTIVVPKKQFNDEAYMMALMKQFGIDFIVLAGFLLVVSMLMNTRWSIFIPHCSPSSAAWECTDTMFTKRSRQRGRPKPV